MNQGDQGQSKPIKAAQAFTREKNFGATMLTINDAYEREVFVAIEIAMAPRTNSRRSENNGLGISPRISAKLRATA